MKTYTLHVSLPGTGRVWRKIEISAEQTLEDLHYAIQNAYEWDADHMYSFFMSGKAWDQDSEYSLPDTGMPIGAPLIEEEEYEEEEMLVIDPGLDEEFTTALKAAIGDDKPPVSMQEMLVLLESNPSLRSPLVKMLSEQLGIPASILDMILNNANSLMNMTPPGMSSVMMGADMAGDVRSTTIGSLDLKVSQKFMYLFDYGDEWRFNVRVHAIDEDADPDADYPRIVESVGEAPDQYPSWDDDEWEEEE